MACNTLPYKIAALREAHLSADARSAEIAPPEVEVAQRPCQPLGRHAGPKERSSTPRFVRVVCGWPRPPQQDPDHNGAARVMSKSPCYYSKRLMLSFSVHPDAKPSSTPLLPREVWRGNEKARRAHPSRLPSCRRTESLTERAFNQTAFRATATCRKIRTFISQPESDLISGPVT